mgnify:CR=1 FL=1
MVVGVGWRRAWPSLGLPIAGDRARQERCEELECAALVSAWAREHGWWMRRVHPRAAPRTATLKRLARDLPDDGVPDKVMTAAAGG